MEVLIPKNSPKLVITKANMENHSKNVPNRNLVVKLAHLGLKRSNNYGNQGFNSLTLF
jgi:hypothetical protein